MPPFPAFFRNAALAGWLAVAATLGGPVAPLNAEEAPVAEAPAAQSRRAIPYRSVVDTVAPDGSYITIGRKIVRTLRITEATRVYNGDGSTGEFEALYPGLEVRGAYRKLEGGTLEAITIRIGPKPSR